MTKHQAARARSLARKNRRISKQADNQELARAANAAGGTLSENAEIDHPPTNDGKSATVKIVRFVHKKSTRKKKSLFVRLRNTLDKEAQAYAAERDRPLGCRIAKAAQCTGRSEVGYHILPRGKWAVRWDLDFRGIGNIVGACSPCNSGERWHRLDYGERHRELFGDEFYSALWEKARESVKHTSTGMQAMLDDIRARRAALGERK